MTIAPIERGFDNKIDLGVLRPPAKFSLGLRERCNELGGISGAAWTMAHGRLAIGNALHGLDQFKHAGPDARTEIKHVCAASLEQHFAGEQMSPRQIVDVNVVSDGAAIGRRKVRTENCKWPIGSASGFDRERNSMRFGLVSLSKVTVWIGTGGVEIAQGDRFQAVSPAEVLQHSLDDHLRPTI